MTNLTMTDNERRFVEELRDEMLRDLARWAPQCRTDSYGDLTLSIYDATSFGELHDWMDANELGGLCDERGERLADKYGIDLFGPDTIFSERWMELTNEAQNLVHDMIVEAGSVRALLRERQCSCGRRTLAWACPDGCTVPHCGECIDVRPCRRV